MIGQFGYNLREVRELRRVREERLLLAQLGVERSHIPFPDEPPIQFPPTATWRALTDLRKDKYESSRLVGAVAQRSREVTKQLNATVTFQGFDDPETKIDDVLKYFTRAYGIEFDINEQAFKDEMIENVREKAIGKVIDKMRNVALSTVLRKVLERLPTPSGTTWVVRNGVVEVTTGRYAASEKAVVAYPIADLVIPITTFQQQASVLQPGQLFGQSGGAYNQLGGLTGIGGIGGLGGLGGGLGGLGGLGGGLGGLGGGGGGLGGLGGLGGGLGGLGGGLGGIGAGLGGLGGAGLAGQGGLGGGMAGIGGVQGLQGGMGGQNIGLGALGGTQAPLLVKMITQLVGEPDDWAPIDPLQLAGTPMPPGGQPEEIDKRPFRNSLAFYPPSLALVVKGSSRIQSRPTPPTLKPAGDAAGMGALERRNPNIRVAGAGDDRPDKKKEPPPKLSDWQKAVSEGVEDPGLIIACVDFLGLMNQWDHAAELLKANIRSAVIVRPWVYDALAMCLRESNASAEEIERADVSAADLEPLDAQGFLKAARGMQEMKHPDAALAFCRQAALLEGNVAGVYRDALDYAAKSKDTGNMEWAITRLLARDWPADNAVLHDLAENRIKDLVALVSQGDKGDAADKLLNRVQDARRRDLEITLVWQNGTTPADLDLVVEEPSGSTCSWRNRQTVGGGILLGGTIGDKKETYVAAQAFPGSYRVRVDRLFGRPLGDKAQLRVVRHKGTPDQREEIITVELPRGAGEMQKDPVVVLLDGGRRTHLADVSPSETTRRVNTAAKSSSSLDAIGQLQRLSDPSGYGPDDASLGVGGPGGTPVGPEPDRSLRDDLAFQTRVKGFVTNNIDVSATAVISADRRYVRFSLAPTFNVVTGTHLQSSQVRNAIIPGFPTP